MKDEKVVGAIGVASIDWRACLAVAEAAELDVMMPVGGIFAAQDTMRTTARPLHAEGYRLDGRGAIQFRHPGDRARARSLLQRPATPAVRKQVGMLEEICRKHEVALAAAALQFPLRHPATSTVAFGAKTAAGRGPWLPVIAYVVAAGRIGSAVYNVNTFKYKNRCHIREIPMHADRENLSQIRELVENWAIWRDACDWQRFRTCWHPEGRMMATWTQGTPEEFISMNKAGFAKGVRILHFLGGSSIDLKGDRAIAQTKMTISQRAEVEGVLCDVTCTGRFYDFVERYQGRWVVYLRQPIYERDRIDAVDPTKTPKLDPEKLNAFPEGYRHLAYLQSAIGYKVKPDMPGLGGPEVEALYARGAAWLEGGPAL